MVSRQGGGEGSRVSREGRGGGGGMGSRQGGGEGSPGGGRQCGHWRRCRVAPSRGGGQPWRRGRPRQPCPPPSGGGRWPPSPGTRTPTSTCSAPSPWRLPSSSTLPAGR